jgi:hypothetical protein
MDCAGKNKDVIFLQNEPEKLFRINKTPKKSAKTNRKIAHKAAKCRFAKAPEMNRLLFCSKKRTGTKRKNEPELARQQRSVANATLA